MKKVVFASIILISTLFCGCKQNRGQVYLDKYLHNDSVAQLLLVEYLSGSDAVAGFYIKDYSGETLVYKAQGFTGTEAKVGDIVTVSGKRGAYKETPQLVSGTFEELKYSVTPVSIKEFLSKGDSKEVYYMVTGMVKDLLDNNGRENVYGNMHLTDGTNDLYVYGCYPGYGAQGEDRKGFVEAAGFEVGDNVTIIGYKDTYNGTVELCGGIFFSLEKADNE